MEELAASEVTVHKLNPLGVVETSYSGRVLERLGHRITLEARWSRPTLSLGFVTFETGDRFIEWFFTDRWYNIFEIHANDGALKGWYCNMAAPARLSPTGVACRDLLLDLWVSPDGALRTLDQEEFDRDHSLTAEERGHALQALDDLCQMVARRDPPFHALGDSTPADLT